MGVSVIQPWHLIIIVIIALLVLGPGKLGDVGGQLGRAVRDFKDTMKLEDKAEGKHDEAVK